MTIASPHASTDLRHRDQGLQYWLHQLGQTQTVLQPLLQGELQTVLVSLEQETDQEPVQRHV